MESPANALVTSEASIDVDAPPDAVYALVANVTRMGEWSPETVGADWRDGATVVAGDWFDGHNKSGDREWTRPCEVARADSGKDFTFVVDGVDKNCTWWSYEMEAIPTGTRLTERWWIVNKTPAMQKVTEQQFADRVAFTETMLSDTIAAIKKVAES